MTWTAGPIRRRYWRTSLAFWLGLIVGIEGTIVVGVVATLVLAQEGPQEVILLMATLGGVSCVTGYGLFFYALWRAYRRSRLLLSGVPQVGAVTAIKEDWWVNYWDHSPAYLKYAFMDDFGTKHQGNSPYLVKAQDKRWRPGDPILVLADRDDPTRHEVDVDGVRQSEFKELLVKLRMEAPMR